MKVALNTQNYNLGQYRHNYQNISTANYSYQPSFKGGISIPAKSNFLASFRNAIDKGLDTMYEGISKHFSKHLYESGIAVWLSKQAGIGKIVNHMQSLGSIIISGMYMSQTLRSNMDDDTKKKLALNQGLTWVVATVGAYIFDNALDSAWDKKVNIKFARRFLGVPDLAKEFENYNESFKKACELAGEKFKPKSVLDFFQDKKYPEYNNKTLLSKIGGLNILKSLVVFGTVYRFLSPVAVTPIANMIGDWFFTPKEEPKTAKPQSDTSFLAASMPGIQTFANRK